MIARTTLADFKDMTLDFTVYKKYMGTCVREYVCVCVRLCACARMRACVGVCVGVCERETERVKYTVNFSFSSQKPQVQLQ